MELEDSDSYLFCIFLMEKVCIHALKLNSICLISLKRPNTHMETGIFTCYGIGTNLATRTISFIMQMNPLSPYISTGGKIVTSVPGKKLNQVMLVIDLHAM